MADSEAKFESSTFNVHSLIINCLRKKN